MPSRWQSSPNGIALADGVLDLLERNGLLTVDMMDQIAEYFGTEVEADRG